MMVPPETADVSPISLIAAVVSSGTVAFLQPWNKPIADISPTNAKNVNPFFMTLVLIINMLVYKVVQSYQFYTTVSRKSFIASVFDTVAQGALSHGMTDEEIDALVEDLNLVVNEESGND